MAVLSRDDFFRVVAENELLAEDQLGTARRVADKLRDPTDVARALVRKGLLTRWQAGQIVAGKKPLRIDKYLLLEMIDSTPWGPVYRAEHPGLKRPAIIKTLARRRVAGENVVEQFFEQAQRLGTLDHRNLIHLYDVDQDKNFYYLAIEDFDGIDLAAKVQRDGPLPPRQAAGYVSQAASGLAKAHDHDIYHHAILPRCLVVDEEDNLKVLETGVARLAASAETSVDLQSAVEAMDYMAPEQVIERSAVDGRTDIYSLGCVLFYLLAGRPPFGGGDASQPMESRLDSAPPDVRDVQNAVPAELSAICAKMMAGKPQERFQSAAEVCQALDAWLVDDAPNLTPAKPAAAPQNKQVKVAQPLPEPVVVVPSPAPRTRQAAAAQPDPEDQNAAAARGSSSVRRWLITGGAAAIVIGVAGGVFISRRTNSDRPEVTSITSPDDSSETAAQGVDAPDTAHPESGTVASAEANATLNVAQPELLVKSVTAPDGTKCPADADGWYSLRAAEEDPQHATYTFLARTSHAPIAGLDVQWRAGADGQAGNLTLNELEVFGGASKDLDGTDRLSVAVADSEPPLADSPCARSADRNIGTACVVPLGDKPVTLRYRFAQPITRKAVGATDMIWVRVVFHLSGDQPAGRFRVNVADKPLTDGAQPTIDPNDGRTLAFWRFEDGLPSSYTPTLELGAKAATTDATNGNDLFCWSPLFAPMYSDDVVPLKIAPVQTAAAKTPSDQLVVNKLALDATEAPVEGSTARFLFTDSRRAQPTVDLEGYPLDQWTIELSLRLATLEGVQTLICKNGQPSALPHPPLKIYFDGDEKRIAVAIIDRSGELRTVETTQDFPISTGEWMHLAAVCDGQKLSLLAFSNEDAAYRNLATRKDVSGGLIDSFGTWSVSAALDQQNATGDMVENAENANENAQAMLDEIRISTAALRPKEFLFAAQSEQVASAKTSESPADDSAPGGDPQVGSKKGQQAAAEPTESPNPFKGVVKRVTLRGLETGDQAPQRLLDFTLADADPLGLDLAGADFAFPVATPPRKFGRTKSAKKVAEPSWGADVEPEPELESAGRFAIRKADDRHWQVDFEPPSGEPTPTAFLDQDEEGLTFRWAPVENRSRQANHLRNCVLLLSSGTHEHPLALREPTSVPHLEIKSGTWRPKATRIRWPPTDAAIGVEVTGVDGKLEDEVQLDDSRPFAAANGTRLIPLGGLYLGCQSQLTSGNWKFAVGPYGRLDYNAASAGMTDQARRGLIAAVGSRSLLALPPEYIKVTPKNLSRFQGLARKRKQFWLAIHQHIKIAELKAPAKQLSDTWESILQSSQGIVQQARALELGGKEPLGEVRFRVFYKAGEHTVDLLVSDATDDDDD